VNNCRNVFRLIRIVDRNVNCLPLANLVGAYCYALKERLRGVSSIAEFSILLNSPKQIQFIENAKNKPLALSYVITEWIYVNCDHCREKLELLRTAENYVAQLIDAQGGLERIAQTPIPYSYIVQINQILGFYLLTLPFCLVHDFGWYSIPAVLLVSFSLLGIEQQGLEMEDPFGTDPSDLPLDSICSNILDNVRFLAANREMLAERAPLLTEENSDNISVPVATNETQSGVYVKIEE
jgi:putative membrane protein